jgi:hypothetical protein
MTVRGYKMRMNYVDRSTFGGRNMQPETPRDDQSPAPDVPDRDAWGTFNEIADRLSYTVGLGTAGFILVVAIPVLFWPRELGRYLNGYTYTLALVIAYFCVPFARRYMPRIKPRRASR